jgi:aspartyl-tRNA(Asn)/glutamyl-tRNA(Gln) amidotransferase subunit A
MVAGIAFSSIKVRREAVGSVDRAQQEPVMRAPPTAPSDLAGADVRADVEHTLAAIERWDGLIGAFVDVLADAAERDAATAAAELSAGHRRSPLHGVPLAVKELFDVESADGSYGSLVLAGRRAEHDAAVVASLRNAGAVVVGVTRSHEFGWGITTQHATRGSTRNPWDLTRIPGGSSGGSAAAVAAGLVPLAVASDTGGSIRLPASFCGVYGLKTTPGRISRRGGVALAPTFDTVGFVARNPDLLASALAATAGPDVADPPTLDAPLLGPAVDPEHAGGLRFCVPDTGIGITPPAAHRQAVDTVAAALADLGGRRVDVSVPPGPQLYDIFVPYQMAEAHHVHHAILGTFPERAADYGADVRARLEAAAQVAIGDYLEAKRLAAEARARLHLVFDDVDVIVTLVSPIAPTTVAQPDAVDIGGRSVRLRDAVMPSTVPQNIAGLPSVTVPVGRDDNGLPVGVQLTGRPWSEQLLLAVAASLERAGACRADVPERFATGG